jgi:hypothetical protein
MFPSASVVSSTVAKGEAVMYLALSSPVSNFAT